MPSPHLVRRAERLLQPPVDRHPPELARRSPLRAYARYLRQVLSLQRGVYRRDHGQPPADHRRYRRAVPHPFLAGVRGR